MKFKWEWESFGEAFISNALIRKIVSRFVEENNRWMRFHELGVYSNAYYWLSSMIEQGYVEEKVEGRKKYFRLRPEIFEQIKEPIKRYLEAERELARINL